MDFSPAKDVSAKDVPAKIVMDRLESSIAERGIGDPASIDVFAPLRRPGFDGVVLAGGRSRRFGADKRIAEIEGGRLLDIAVTKLASVVPGVLFVAGGSLRADLDGDRRPQAGVDAWLCDDPCESGPMGGVVAALSRTRYGLLVLACDMPRVRTSTLRALAQVGRRTGRPVVPRCSRGWEPLAAYYPTSMLAPLRAAVNAGVRAPHRLLDGCGALPLAGWCEAEFVNINRPTDLMRLRN